MEKMYQERMKKTSTHLETELLSIGEIGQLHAKESTILYHVYKNRLKMDSRLKSKT